MTETKTQPEQLLTVADVASRCKVATKTVRRWSVGLVGFPKPRRVGNVLRWREAEVNEFVRNFGKR